jgi:hypothetical protein
MIDPTLPSFVLAVSTAWAAIFLGFLPAQTLRLDSREVLKLGGGWMVVGLTSPPAIRHWYFIFALVCLGSWIKLRTDRALAGKIWLGIAGGLGISIGVIFFIQAAPAVCPLALPPRDYLLLLASIYLGGAVTGLAYAGHVLARSSQVRARGYARLLTVLAISWCAVVAAELRLISPSVMDSLPPQRDGLLVAMLLTTILSFLAFQATCTQASGRAKWIFATVTILAFGAQFLARRLIL